MPIVDQRSEAARSYRKLYKLKAWFRLRIQAFIRDGYICHWCGKHCPESKSHPHHAVADHIIDHKGNRALFFDLGNIRTVGKSCHDRHSQRQAHGTLKPEIGTDGWPISDGYPP